MPGEIRGFFFKYLINSLLEETIEYLFSDLKARIREMRDDEWYDWDEFQAAAGQIGEALGDETIKSVGNRLILQSKEVFIQQGYDTIIKLLKNYPKMFNRNIRNIPESQQVKIVSFELGRVIYHYPKGQPKAFIEGHFSGFFNIYNLIIDSIYFKDEGDYYIVEVRW